LFIDRGLTPSRDNGTLAPLGEYDMDFARELFDSFFGLGTVTSPIYLFVCVAIAFLIYQTRNEDDGFVAWLVPRHIWTHRSTGLDLVLFAIGRVMSALGLVTRFTVTPLFAAMFADHLPWNAIDGANLSPIALGFIFWIASDFSVYWVHRAHHQIKTIWPLHAVHHSAEVMTPFTAYRQHPLGLLVIAAIQTMIMGIVLGILIGSLNPDATTAQIFGVNAFTIVAILLMSNFHHAHINISYGPVLERIFISPTMHRVHHSTDPAHYNKNYGSFLAIWDWMFGTLYVTKGNENLTLGLTTKDDAPLMTHRLGPVLIDPVRRMFRPTR
jgi:sterol desaturase/sphingolipid hydroxylase (fatty acid hydroxylase superfamily)